MIRFYSVFILAVCVSFFCACTRMTPGPEVPQPEKELFAFYCKAMVPEGWHSDSVFGYFWAMASPDGKCGITATVARYEVPDEALLIRAMPGAAVFRKSKDAQGYLFTQNGNRAWLMASGEMTFILESYGPCEALSSLLSSVEAVRNKKELDALRGENFGPKDNTPYWAWEELPDMGAIMQALSSKEIRDWLTFTWPACASSEKAVPDEKDAAGGVREYRGKRLTALYPEGWTVRQTRDDLSFVSPDGKKSVFAIARKIPEQSDAGILAFVREYRQHLGGKNMLRMREDRGKLENRYRFMLLGSGAVVVIDARTVPARIVTYSDSALAATWENEMDHSVYVTVNEEE